MKKNSYKVALGGVIASLCLLMMFMTGVFPILAMTLPVFAGMLISVAAIEINPKWGFATYAAVSALSLFLTPDKESAVLFIMFFGYYPIFKNLAERVKLKILQWVMKIIVFNIAIVAAYQVIINVLGTVDFFEEFGFFNDYLISGILGFGNIVFILYDVTLSLVMTVYKKWFRPTFIKKIK